MGFGKTWQKGLMQTGFPACELVVERVPDAAGKTSETFVLFSSLQALFGFFFFSFF